ncbi:DUF5916 domain-containing protein [Melioribacteraceae bacterium 4301-Me]|uniref:carbohydrate binding family 9 domain-containing protein n=1 Tax=Pyranulibacter aquaticus TaxID=3163344 RepID=UPI0035967B46
MKKTLLLLLFTTLIYSANETKVLYLKKTPEKIKIDGIIDDAWSNADSTSDFFQLQPYYGNLPDRKTTVKVLTTEESLYCLMICYDNRENIQSITGKQDDHSFGSDVVSIMLDTFGDNRTAYKFAVSASGVRADCRLLDDARNRDYSWDGIWFSAAKVYDWGFVVEWEIPYKSLQYDESLNEWGLDFDRWIPHLSEDLYWCKYERNEGQRISKFGKLVFQDFKPSVKGLNLEIYPVALTKASYLYSNKYKIEPTVGLDVFYNPSAKLTLQATLNPDFAQIEADPFAFNISRYETYYQERRPFFTQGNEIFMPSGKDRNSGFYKPLELFYSRRIGKKLPDGKEVPLTFGAKTFGRLGQWEYGGFIARTAETSYLDQNGNNAIEPTAYFASGRIKKQMLDNSTLGILFVGKKTTDSTYGVIDIDGAIRSTNWQLAYQLARSIKNSEGDYAASFGFTSFSKTWVTLIRGRLIGNNFDVSQIGFVPWKGTSEIGGITGPIWFFDEGFISQILFMGGAGVNYESVDNYTDRFGILVFNMQFRNNWGYEFDFSFGKSKDLNVLYNSYELDFSSWYNISPKWDADLYGGYSKTYNFSRDYLAFYSWAGASVSWKAMDILELGSSYNMYIEGNPSGKIEDITYNLRPYFSLTPINDFNLRMYFDNVFVKSKDQNTQVILGILFSYQFLPKSWIYFAWNEIHTRQDIFDFSGNVVGSKFNLLDRASVIKIKYLYFF